MLLEEASFEESDALRSSSILTLYSVLIADDLYGFASCSLSFVGLQFWAGKQNQTESKVGLQIEEARGRAWGLRPH